MSEVHEPIQFAGKEQVRRDSFEEIWTNDLEPVFADVAPYYDRANLVASFGTFNRVKRNFVVTFDLAPGMKVVDVCAGTNAVGIALMNQEPGLEVTGIDRSAPMLLQGQKMAKDAGFEIEKVKADVHRMPFPDNSFDIATIQYASRHLRLIDVFTEIKRVLKPGGHLYQCDMLRPASRVVEEAYYLYLRTCLNVTALLFGSSESAHKLKRYFIQAIKKFYSAEEMSQLMRDVGYEPVVAKPVMLGMIAYHKAMKPLE